MLFQTLPSSEPDIALTDRVVLLDVHGRPTGTAPKASVHHAHTPLHLGFSCYVVDRHDRVLITRRSHRKQTWPGVWTNACCGHPSLGETLQQAVTRRLGDELGLGLGRIAVALPDFTYRAVMSSGVVEHELCPVSVAEVTGQANPDPEEVDDLAWVPWSDLQERARLDPGSLSPWSVSQIRLLSALAPSLSAWLHLQTGGERADHATLLEGTIAPGDPIGVRPTPRVVSAPKSPEPVGRPAPEAAPEAGPWVGPVDPLDVVTRPVDGVLDRFLAGQEDELALVDKSASRVSRQVRRLVDAGGKRLRPAFVYWGHRATGAAHDDAVFVAGAAVELLHTFALIHDDVMDRSDVRRGGPSTHLAFAGDHAEEGMRGDGDWFGVSAAILAGDLTFVWADRLLEDTPVDAERLAHARRVFADLRVEVMAGQYLDLRLAAAAEADETLARRVAVLKSARYTVTRPLQLGAALAGRTAGGTGTSVAGPFTIDLSGGGAVTALAADARRAGRVPANGTGATGPDRLDERLIAYGDAVGLAFQLRDDVLGMFGDPSHTGKSSLDDLREGKRTLLALRALELTDGLDHDQLARSLGDPGLDAAGAERCRHIVAGSGALASVETLIEAQYASALDALDGLPDPARSALARLADLAAHRDA